MAESALHPSRSEEIEIQTDTDPLSLSQFSSRLKHLAGQRHATSNTAGCLENDNCHCQQSGAPSWSHFEWLDALLASAEPSPEREYFTTSHIHIQNLKRQEQNGDFSKC